MDPISELSAQDLSRILKANNAVAGTNVEDLMEMLERLAATQEGTALLVELAANAAALCFVLSVEIGALHAYMSEVMESLEEVLFDYGIASEKSRDGVGSSYADAPSNINMMP